MPYEPEIQISKILHQTRLTFWIGFLYIYGYNGLSRSKKKTFKVEFEIMTIFRPRNQK